MYYKRNCTVYNKNSKAQVWKEVIISKNTGNYPHTKWEGYNNTGTVLFFFLCRIGNSYSSINLIRVFGLFLVCKGVLFWWSECFFSTKKLKSTFVLDTLLRTKIGTMYMSFASVNENNNSTGVLTVTFETKFKSGPFPSTLSTEIKNSHCTYSL